MLRIAIPSVLQQSTVSIGMMIVQAVVNPFGTQALAGYAATMRVENVFSLMFVSIGNAVSPYVSQNLGANKTSRIKKGYRAALLLDTCFAALAFIVIETLHTQISSLFLGKDGTALAYQVSGDYMRWLGYFFIFMAIIQAIDRKVALDDIALSKGIEFGELLDEVEAIVYSGTKLNIDYFLEEIMDEDHMLDIYDYFKESTTDKIDDALDELGDDFTEEEVRLVRIKFISEMAN